MRRVSAWLTQPRAADASKAGNRETGYIGSRPNRQQVQRGGTQPLLSRFLPPGMPQPGITELRIELPPRGVTKERGRTSAAERKGEDAYAAKVAGPGRG